MDRQEIVNEYFNWLYDLVYPGSDPDGDYSFGKLARHLYFTDFYSSVERDENRSSDGIDLRYKFGWEKGYSDREILISLDNRPCSLLEMMVALSIRCEHQFMSDCIYGDRTGQWFRKMIVSMGYGGMYNCNFIEARVNYITNRFLNREYQPNGEGGLFEIKHPSKDMTKLEIWAQLCEYLNTLHA